MSGMRTHLRAQTVWITILDLASLVAGAIIGVAVRIGHAEVGEYVLDHLHGWLIFFGAFVLANYLAGSYKIQHAYSRFNLLVTWLFALGFALLTLSVSSYAFFQLLLGRGVLGWAIFSYSVISLFMRLLVYRQLFRSGLFLCRTVIIGSGTRAMEFRKMVESDYVLPAHKVVAYVGFDPHPAGHRDAEVVDGVVTLRTLPAEFEDLVRSLSVTLIILGLEEGQALPTGIYAQLRRLRFEGVEVLTALTAAEIYAGKTLLPLIDEQALMVASMESGLPVVRRFKRLFDIAVATVGCLLGAPLMAVTALVIKLTEPKGRVLYRQTRAGQFGRVFTIYKFRTMREGAERETGPVWADENDPRITRVGRFLRRTRLDELPQLWNVLVGDMSIVGPRPERPEIIAKLEREIPFYHERGNVMPGLTGWAQIKYPYGNSVEDAARKLEYDLYYIKHLTLSLDLQIILRTVRTIVFGSEGKRTKS